MQGNVGFPWHIVHAAWDKLTGFPTDAKSLLEKTVKKVPTSALEALMGKLINSNFKSYCEVFICANSLPGSGKSSPAPEIFLFIVTIFSPIVWKILDIYMTFIIVRMSYDF